MSMEDRAIRRYAPRDPDWLRSNAARALLAAALAIALVAGGVFVSVDRLHDTPDDTLLRADAVSDEQSRAQAVGYARRAVDAAGLRPTTAGYLLMSCGGHQEPPYQGAIHLTFALPAEQRADTYFQTVATALRFDGWIEGLAPGGHAYGSTMSKDGVTAVLYRHDDNPSLGVLRLYGECRNMADHRNDVAGWVDVTSQVDSAR
ncbi:hypothetical protein BST16_21155 [Mycobacterium asiaticum DSM 44297]|nr:hypothetical protein BST16_21155 [Mycobacterium asiaticum DSM 44297]